MSIEFALELTCTACGHKWQEIAQKLDENPDMRCPSCREWNHLQREGRLQARDFVLAARSAEAGQTPDESAKDMSSEDLDVDTPLENQKQRTKRWWRFW